MRHYTLATKYRTDSMYTPRMQIAEGTQLLMSDVSLQALGNFGTSSV